MVHDITVIRCLTKLRLKYSSTQIYIDAKYKLTAPDYVVNLLVYPTSSVKIASQNICNIILTRSVKSFNVTLCKVKGS